MEKIPMKAKNPFKRGDKVRYRYGESGPIDGVISRIEGEYCLVHVLGDGVGIVRRYEQKDLVWADK
jgi:hypothetical protein